MVLNKQLNVSVKSGFISGFEIGNANKNVPRPVCAVNVTVPDIEQRVKLLFKGPEAVKVYKYFAGRNAVLAQGLMEKKIELLSCSGTIREIRKTELVLENIENLKIDLSFKME
jgi:hypothetical protein